MHRRHLGRMLSVESLEPRHLLAADPMITEFMASNATTLDDGNGASSDWIEIYNNGDQSVDLAGYGLTDDPADANKWEFPSYTLDPGKFLVVFASGNNTPDSAGNLHTNFALSAGGDYVGLADPGGNVLSEFGPGGTDYPAQTSDVAYGLAFDTSATSVVSPNSSARYLIPTNDSVDATWTDHGFNDASWQTGTASIGYENSPENYANLIQTTVPTGTTSVYVRIDFTISDSDSVLDKLQMKYDDGFIAYINGTRVTSDNAPTTGAYNSIATGEHPDGLAVDYVDFDVSAHSGVLDVGANTLAIHMLNRSGSSDLLSVPNLLLASGGPVTPAVTGELLSPTPGLPNTNLRASDVLFSRVGGAFVGSFQLVMTTSDLTESIRYTTDGSIPHSGSPLYTGPITVSSTTQFRARAFGASGQVGGVTTEAFTRTATATGNFTSNLPIVVLENFNQGTPGGSFQDANLALYEVDAGTGRSALANPADVTTRIGQHRRGSSTSGNPKTNLRIELRDNNDQDRSISLLGMPAEADWVLYAPYNFDRALMRNSVLFDLSSQAGNYAPRTRFVEVYSNTDDGTLDADDYMGVYVLMENIKRDSNRVDIDELTATQNTAPEITGGYILKLDRSDGTPDSSWFTDRGIPTLNDSRLVHVEPERADMTLAQRNYIRGYVQDFEDALFGPNSTDPVLGYEAYFDVDASIDHHLYTVLSKDPDGLRLSTYLTKDRGGKLAYGPLWDFDRAMGPDDDGRASNPTGWSLPDVDVFESDWWGPLFDDPDFMQRWVDRWQQLRETVLSDANILATVNGQAAEIGEAAQRNFAKWTNIAPNGGTYAQPGLTGWEAEVSHLAGWLVARANWMDEQMVTVPTFSPLPGNVAPGTQITLSATPLDAEIYYTLDGSDPRADGGDVAPNAVLYTGAITAIQTTQITARTLGTPIMSVGSNSSYPGNESPSHGLDGNPNTKYLNFGEENSGIIITPNFGSSVVRSIKLTTANDAVERDPSSWELYGTNESIQSTDNSTGLTENWTLISSGNVALPFARQTDGPVLSFANSSSYTSYKLMFPTVKNPGSANSMQVADIRFYETSNGTGTQILSAGDNALAVHVASGGGADGLSPWSQIARALFSIEVPADPSSLRITEVHYHPANPTAAELSIVPGADQDSFEFIKLQNVSNNTISLNGVRLSEGVTFDFTTGAMTSLAPGETTLVVEDAAAFAARYGGGLPVAGQYTDKLANGGERLVLTDSTDAVIHDFVYDDDAPWPIAADGAGPSMEIIDPLSDHSVGANWRASATVGGSPGVHAADLPGDFDQDSNVDGADFLAWQRGVPNVYNGGDLANWEANFGVGLGSAAALATGAVEVPIAAFAESSTDESATPVAISSSDDPNSFFDVDLYTPIPVVTAPPPNQRAALVDAAFAQWRPVQRIALSAAQRFAAVQGKVARSNDDRNSERQHDLDFGVDIWGDGVWIAGGDMIVSARARS